MIYVICTHILLHVDGEIKTPTRASSTHARLRLRAFLHKTNSPRDADYRSAGFCFTIIHIICPLGNVPPRDKSVNMSCTAYDMISSLSTVRIYADAKMVVYRLPPSSIFMLSTNLRRLVSRLSLAMFCSARLALHGEMEAQIVRLVENKAALI